jgi:hypothetical protein
MNKKHKPAGYPGHGKSKTMKKLAKKLKRKYVDVPMPKKKEWTQHLDAFAALAGSLPIHICTGNRPEDGIEAGPLREFIFAKPPVPGMVEHMDALVTFWDGQLDDMSGGFHLLRDRLVNAEDHATLKLVDELLHRVIEVRCQLDTMKKEQNQ